MAVLVLLPKTVEQRQIRAAGTEQWQRRAVNCQILQEIWPCGWQRHHGLLNSSMTILNQTSWKHGARNCMYWGMRSSGAQCDTGQWQFSDKPNPLRCGTSHFLCARKPGPSQQILRTCVGKPAFQLTCRFWMNFWGQIQPDMFYLPERFKARPLRWWMNTCVRKLQIVWCKFSCGPGRRCLTPHVKQQSHLVTNVAAYVSWGLCSRTGPILMPHVDWIWFMLQVLIVTVLCCRLQGSAVLHRSLSIPVTIFQEAVTSSHASIFFQLRSQTYSAPVDELVSRSGPKAGGGRVRARSPGQMASF